MWTSVLGKEKGAFVDGSKIINSGQKHAVKPTESIIEDFIDLGSESNQSASSTVSSSEVADQSKALLDEMIDMLLEHERKGN